ncbi:LysE family transporter (plasmid) [Pseudoalteromonas espejiana]
MYLLYLAYGLAFKAKRQLNENNKGVKPNKLIQTGFILAISNPKVILFWLAFILQQLLKHKRLMLFFVVIVVTTFCRIEGCIENAYGFVRNRAGFSLAKLHTLH